jgi:hypothetical protein
MPFLANRCPERLCPTPAGNPKSGSGAGGKKQGFAAPRGVRLAAMAFVQWTPAVRIWLGVFPVQRLNACVNALKSLKPSSHAIFWRDLKVDNPSAVNTQPIKA